MKSSFKDVSSTEATASVAEQTVPMTDVPAVVEKQALVPDSFFNHEDMEGDFDRSDIQLPRLNLVQNVGPLTEHFTPGRFIFNKELDLGGGPLEVTLVRMKKYFMEEVPYGSETIPMIVHSVEDVRKAGGLLSSEKREFGEGHKYFKSVLDTQVLIKGDPTNSVFPFEFNGTPYAVALWTLHGVSYGRAGKQFITASQFGLKTGLAGAFWSVQAKREKVGQNFIWLPIARQAGRNTPEFVEWARSLSA